MQNKNYFKNNYANNFLKITNTKKDEINSIKNTIAITYYNKSYINKKSINNNKNNIFLETYRNYKNITKTPINCFNNIKVIQSYTKYLTLFLPDFQKKNNSRQKVGKKGYTPSYSVSNKEIKNKLNLILISI